MKYYKILFLVFCIQLNSQDSIKSNQLKDSMECFSEGLTCLLTDKSQLSHGASKVIQSVTDVASLQVQETNLSPEDLIYLQESVTEFEQGLFDLLNKDKLQFRNHAPLLREGLSELFYHMFCLVVWRKDVKVHLKNIFVALLKVITAIISDSGVEEKDLQNIQSALHDALDKKVYCYACKTLPIDSYNIQPKKFDSNEIKLKRSADELEKKEQVPLNPEQVQIKNSFNSIINTIIKIVLHPSKICFSYVKSIFDAIVGIVQAIFADGKVDGQDLENIQVALENIGRKANSHIY